MVKIHIFNPEHELALAFGKANFTPPAAGRGMRRWLGFLPAFWASDGDIVVVDNLQDALNAASEYRRYLADVAFAEPKMLPAVMREVADGIKGVEPWGWNTALRWQMIRAGVPEGLMPTEAQLNAIRLLSHRRSSIGVLAHLTGNVPGTVGERDELQTYDMVRQWLDNHSGVGVLKAPWSSSGRGVKFALAGIDSSLVGFVHNTLLRQGGIIVEPYYERSFDFAMEFIADGKGNAEYMGLSAFDTKHGAYNGNMIAPEFDKWHIINVLMPKDSLLRAKNILKKRLGTLCRGVYSGPVGVDMMAVRVKDRLFLHPCVEINFRRTMGHVALSVAERVKSSFSRMRIVYTNRQYKLVLEKDLP